MGSGISHGRSCGHAQVADVFESAEKLGLKVVRMWAFNDGDGWNALQPRIGQINEHILRRVARAAAVMRGPVIGCISTCTLVAIAACS